MINLKLVGAAVVLSIALLGPAMANHPVRPHHSAMSTYCATIEPGNPYSPVYDYGGWSGWRVRGGWDSRGDNACARNPMYSGGTTF